MSDTKSYTATVTQTVTGDVRKPPALTTLWTRPTSCPLTVTWDPGEGHAVKAMPHSEIRDPLTLSCYPPFYDIVVSTFSGHYSPGLCPQGHTIARIEETSGITTADCCAYAFTFYLESCYTTIPPPATLLWSSNKSAPTLRPFTSAEEWRHPVRIKWEKTDEAVLKAANVSYWSISPINTVPDNSTTTSPSPTTLDAPQAASPTTEAASPTGLSTAARAGIGAAIGITVVFLLFLAGAWIRRRRQKRQGEAPGTSPPSEANAFHKSELPTNEPENIPRELDMEGRVVAWGDSSKLYVPPVELPGAYEGYVSTSRGDLTEMGDGYHSIQHGGYSPHISELGSGTIGPDRSRTVSGVESDRTVHGGLTPSSPPLPSPLSNPSSPPLHHSP